MNIHQSYRGKSILVVDDDDILRSRLRKAFERRGLVVTCADGYDSALKAVAEFEPELAVLDLKMPEHSGLELLEALKDIVPAINVIILTGYGSITNAVDAVKLGAINYVTKPADADQVLAAFNRENIETTSPEYCPPSLAQAEWDHIQRVLAECDGNISEAARMLDIPRRTLQRKLKKRP